MNTDNTANLEAKIEVRFPRADDINALAACGASARTETNAFEKRHQDQDPQGGGEHMEAEGKREHRHH